MFDINEIAIVAAITVTTVVFTVVCIQLILILRDIRVIVKKMSNLTNHLESFGFNVTSGYSEAVGFLVGFKKVFKVLELLAEKNAKHAKKA
jgi:hypothetical protein